jgi:hypothetical protein
VAHDKTIKSGKDKRKGKSLKEKRAEKHAKKAEKASRRAPE